MRAWTAGDDGGITLGELPVPTPEPGELVVKVEVCGVCRTDLHVIDHELDVHRHHVVPGHQVVGRVVAGFVTDSIPLGSRVGIAWLRSTCGACEYRRSGRENLCAKSEYTGWDADGGYAEYTTVPAAYCYVLADTDDARAIAPLLCAGIIGYRSLVRAKLPPGG
jgi:propanol-preferring alcohol dehydrogenase